jgi:leucine efflux protein
MSGITDYPAFCLAVLIFLMLPGPGTFAVLTSAAKGRIAGGFASLAGIMLGDWLLMAAAMLGVATLLQAHPLVFKGVQWLGIAYLVWVGAQLLFARENTHATLLPITNRRFFRQTFLITLINPKAIVFYMAFFPQFINPATFQGASTLAVMGISISIITFAYGSLLVFAGNTLAQKLGRNPRVAKFATRAAGVSLIGFGAKLAID